MVQRRTAFPLTKKRHSKSCKSPAAECLEQQVRSAHTNAFEFNSFFYKCPFNMG